MEELVHDLRRQRLDVRAGRRRSASAAAARRARARARGSSSARLRSAATTGDDLERPQPAAELDGLGGHDRPPPRPPGPPGARAPRRPRGRARRGRRAGSPAARRSRDRGRVARRCRRAGAAVRRGSGAPPRPAPRGGSPAGSASRREPRPRARAPRRCGRTRPPRRRSGRRASRPARSGGWRRRPARRRGRGSSSPRAAPIFPAPITRIRLPASWPECARGPGRRPRPGSRRASCRRRSRAARACPSAARARTSRERTRPGRVGRGGELVRLAHLAQDLRLARHERVEPGGDAEEMERGVGAAALHQHGLEHEAGALVERLASERLEPLGAVAGEVELGAVAGREHDRLDALAGEARGERAGILGRQVDALADVEPGRAVRHSDRTSAAAFAVRPHGRDATTRRRATGRERLLQRPHDRAARPCSRGASVADDRRLDRRHRRRARLRRRPARRQPDERGRRSRTTPSRCARSGSRSSPCRSATSRPSS